KMGISKNDFRSIKAAIIYTLENTAFGEGDLYLDYDNLKQKADKLLASDIDYHEAINILIDEKRIKEEDGNYFLKEIYDTEYQIAKSIKRFINQPKKNLDLDLLKLLLSQISIQKGIDYTELQQQAILEAMQNPLSIITGGPGTGKTTLIDGLLNLYASYYKIKLKSPEAKEQIALMAPTGRAAKRMKEILSFDARTIHSHLGFDFASSRKNLFQEPLHQDLIIID